jgi:hypothetical protein
MRRSSPACRRTPTPPGVASGSEAGGDRCAPRLTWVRTAASPNTRCSGVEYRWPEFPLLRSFGSTQGAGRPLPSVMERTGGKRAMNPPGPVPVLGLAWGRYWLPPALATASTAQGLVGLCERSPTPLAVAPALFLQESRPPPFCNPWAAPPRTPPHLPVWRWHHLRKASSKRAHGPINKPARQHRRPAKLGPVLIHTRLRDMVSRVLGVQEHLRDEASGGTSVPGARRGDDRHEESDSMHGLAILLSVG